MKKTLFTLLFMSMMSVFSFGQKSTDDLWKKVAEAEEQDLPKTEQKYLRQIAEICEREGDYAQLLKAELREARSLCSVSTDSLEPAVERMKVREQQAKDSVLRAVYCTVLGYLYKDNSQLDEDNYLEISREYYDRALRHSDLLAATKTKAYDFVIDEGSDSRFFGHDLLSVIGYEAERFDILHDYYAQSGNREAELLCALKLIRQQRPDEMQSLDSSPYLHSLDSLISRFADLDVCGEVAIERFSFMESRTRATAEQKIAYIDEALSRWGQWKRIVTLKNERNQLTAHQYHATLDAQVIPTGQWSDIPLTNLRGINTMTMRVYTVKADGSFPYDPNSGYYYEDHVKKLLTPQPDLTQTIQFGEHLEYELFDSLLRLPPLPLGVYMLEFESTPSTRVSRHLIYVSNVRVLAQPMPEGKIRFVAVDAITGQPLPKADLKVTSSTGYYSESKTFNLTTDERGECLYTKREKERDCSVFATFGDDKFCRPVSESSSFSYYGGSETGTGGSVYTDRQLYRPGQTVHAAVILYHRYETIRHAVDAGVKVTFQLNDANGKTVETQDAVTDDYGTCAVDFRLPKTGLAGQFSVKATCKREGSSYENTYSESIRVEEYKRPTFEVEIPTVETAYADGDTVQVTGTARTYSGVKVQGAKVKYKVTRRRAFWWWAYYSYWNQMYIGRDSDDQVLAEGEAVTADDGTFTVPVPITVPKTAYPMFYNFVVNADVTDQAGETHAASVSLPMGNKPLAFSADVPEKVLREEGASLSFSLRNASGRDLDEQVRYRFDGGRWLTAQTGDEIDMPLLKSGRHTLDATCKGETLQQTFTVFSLDDTTPAEETDDWFYVSHSQFPRDGQPVTLQVGASDPDLHIVYAIYAGKKVIESGSRDISNALINLKLTYEEAYGNGLLLTYAWVKNGKVHTHNASISRPLPDTRLRLQWATFRDRLTPGQQEEWTLSIVRPDGTPADAQLMATLYDKSLDQIEQHNWSLGTSLYLSTPNTRWGYGSWDRLSWNGYSQADNVYVPMLNLSTFNHRLYPARWVPRHSYGRRLRGRAAAGALMVEEEPVMLAKVAENESLAMPAPQAADSYAAEADEAVEEEAAADGGAGEGVQMRTNLDETAFFLPQLTTDSTGHVALRFTLPECLTTWRCLGVAHTKDMFCGSIDGEAIARKDVMVQPNMPRFLRHGDRAVITTRIFNTSDRELQGTARLQLLDPGSEAAHYDESLTVTVAADGTASVSFDVDCTRLPIDLALLIARVSFTAEVPSSEGEVGGSVSDGEQHYLPMLPDREHVTRTMPITQHKPGTLDIDLKALVPDGATGEKLTLEYTNNPAWLMIQALPAIGHPHDDCLVCQAASFYANSIGMGIIAQNPNAKEVFRQWEQEQGDETSLMSNLAKNQELQDLVLDETPWVADADSEQEQKARLADFFDADLMNQRLDASFEKMKKLQNSDGSWSWWPDMPGSFYLTVSISQMVVRLQHMQLTNTSQLKKLDPNLNKAFKFMGKKVIEIVEEMKKAEKKGYEVWFPSQTVLDWLYICTIDGRELPRKVAAANDYLLAKLRKEIKSQSIYGKAMSAVVFSASDPKLAKKYIQSLSEYTVYREDMGRYYDTPRALYCWRDYRIPTQVAAIEAMQRLTPEDTQTIDEMLRWLLQEKRTQAWDTPLSTIDAIYAFLNGRPQTLAPQAETSFTLGGKTLATPQATAGLGYIKTVLPAASPMPSPSDGPASPATLTVSKTSEGTSWGAVYAQFLQPSTQIDAQASGLTVTREVLPANPQSTSKSQSSNLNSPLHPGDRVRVRITIVADRDYDFVEVIDKRAACLEPVNQKSGYHWGRGSYYEGYYCTPRDCTTNFYFDRMAKGKHVIETEYYIDRPGTYQTGSCTVSCAYAPEFRGTDKALELNIGQPAPTDRE